MTSTHPAERLALAISALTLLLSACTSPATGAGDRGKAAKLSAPNSLMD